MLRTVPDCGAATGAKNVPEARLERSAIDSPGV